MQQYWEKINLLEPLRQPVKGLFPGGHNRPPLWLYRRPSQVEISNYGIQQVDVLNLAETSFPQITMKEFNELCSGSFKRKNNWSIATRIRRNECGLPQNFKDIECFHLNMENPPSTLTWFRLDLCIEQPTNFLCYWNASSSLGTKYNLIDGDIPSRILSCTHRRFVIVAYQRQGHF